jgi:hypothetical protein
MAVADSPQPTSSADLLFSSCRTSWAPEPGMQGACDRRLDAGTGAGDGVREVGLSGDLPVVGGLCSGSAVLLQCPHPGGSRSGGYQPRLTAPRSG